jgi:hypothetical protein
VSVTRAQKSLGETRVLIAPAYSDSPAASIRNAG